MEASIVVWCDCKGMRTQAIARRNTILIMFNHEHTLTLEHGCPTEIQCGPTCDLEFSSNENFSKYKCKI